MYAFAITSIFSILAVVINLILGFLILHKRPYRKDQKLFCIFIVITSLWILVSNFSNYPFGLEFQTFLLKFDYFLAPYAIYAHLIFVQSFGKTKPTLDQFFLFILGLISTFFSFLAISTNLLIDEAYIVPAGIASGPGPLDSLFALFLVFMLIISITSLIRKTRKASGHEKLQAVYITLGSTLTAATITITNLFLWRLLNLDISTSYWVVLVIPSIGRSGTILFSAFAAYAIIRHRLFGIRVIVGELLFWLVGSTLTFVFFYGTILFESRLFDSLTSPIAIFLNIILALVVFPTLRATNNWLRHTIRKISINVSFDHEHVLKEYNQEITQCHTTTEIIASLFKFVIEIYSPKFIGIVLIEHLTSNITAEWKGLTPEQLINVENEEVITELFNENSQKIKELLPNFELQMPIELTGYQGILVLGTRKDHSAYAIEDIQFLERVLEFTTLNLPRTFK